ncbi:hypothetical protein PN419_00450 [Halorubrum ezzemoulense]|uniref:hypothetical protein n=1 Tax=Halorubrum ezzemoulense TaxID=337243 RepID=UPI00232AF6CF|nr:hypothetical protein [Halorubrum ezzemoulense]MDB9247477.1 hypothetical protein [Halorubrum ezzemoulense]MDB9258614.1 hypothetical protein [Halorubrum ezzemoulense]MDB9264527.1 hypothetical protein [Halorubrum ezzemoulense]MDB9268975.1 hypothetical protein [Halorubrum ezzemoulense]MDB9271495.1 hypothetical protein [Halorubrum ezzemoulense]
MSVDDTSGIDPDTTVAELVDLGPNERLVDVDVDAETETEPIHVNGVRENIEVGPDVTTINDSDSVDTPLLAGALLVIEESEGAIGRIDLTDTVAVVYMDTVPKRDDPEEAYDLGVRNHNIEVEYDSGARSTYSGWLLTAIREFHDL